MSLPTPSSPLKQQDPTFRLPIPVQYWAARITADETLTARPHHVDYVRI
jgi:hypothetical protein